MREPISQMSWKFRIRALFALLAADQGSTRVGRSPMWIMKTPIPSIIMKIPFHNYLPRKFSFYLLFNTGSAAFWAASPRKTSSEEPIGVNHFWQNLMESEEWRPCFSSDHNMMQEAGSIYSGCPMHARNSRPNLLYVKLFNYLRSFPFPGASPGFAHPDLKG